MKLQRAAILQAQRTCLGNLLQRQAATCKLSPYKELVWCQTTQPELLFWVKSQMQPELPHFSRSLTRRSQYTACQQLLVTFSHNLVKFSRPTMPCASRNCRRFLANGFGSKTRFKLLRPQISATETRVTREKTPAQRVGEAWASIIHSKVDGQRRFGNDRTPNFARRCVCAEGCDWLSEGL